ncbi:MAG: lipoyl synthase [Chlamydiales bacterium]|nr:lipoyl synthase [Chlamydiales bacterium]
MKHKLNVLPSHTEKKEEESVVGPGRFPSWLHRKLPKGGSLATTGLVLTKHRLHTVCEEAKCPNLIECWSKKTATFLAMGKECTRNCGFCDIDFSKAPKPLDPEEPTRIALSIKELGLKHVVITMVARDDLPDGGAHHLVAIMKEVRNTCLDTSIEVLTSDFSLNYTAIDTVIEAKPEIYNHNIETVKELTPRVRHKASYERTLTLLSYVKIKDPSIHVKSGIMVGLGETEEQVKETLLDLKHAGCSIVTIGQYLQPDKKKLLVKSFVTPEQFKHYEEYGHQIGIPHIYSGPFVRSSYNASEFFNKIKNS